MNDNPIAEPERHHSWIVRKEVEGGFFTSCRFNSPIPCTADDRIYHPEW